MVDIIKRDKDNKYIILFSDNRGNYKTWCNCVTGLYGGYNRTAVINHPRGYSSYSSACRAFKRIVGVTKTEFNKSC